MAGLVLTMHPASEGDCLVLSWGEPARHALIDLGRTRDYRALRPWLDGRALELFVISHIDADHISGAMPLVREAAPPFTPADVWFNGYAHLAAAKRHLQPLEALSVAQGDKLEKGIRRFGWPWNAAFGGGPAVAGAAPVDLAGGLRLTLVGPAEEDLARLEAVWNRWLKKTGLRADLADDEAEAPPGLERLSVLDVEALAAEPFKEDDEPPNGASIALLAEFRGKRVLLGADAHPSRIAASLGALGYGPDNRLRLDLCKLCHHGSKGNTSPDLLAMLDCTRFAISTDGSRHDHPDPQTIARILVADPEREKAFYFNTVQQNATAWDRDDLKVRWRYRCHFPTPPAKAGLAIAV